MPQYAWVIPVGIKVTYCITVPVVSRVSHFVLYGVRSWYLPQNYQQKLVVVKSLLIYKILHNPFHSQLCLPLYLHRLFEPGLRSYVLVSY